MGLAYVITESHQWLWPDHDSSVRKILGLGGPGLIVIFEEPNIPDVDFIVPARGIEGLVNPRKIYLVEPLDMRLQSVNWLSRFSDIIEPTDPVARADGN